MSAAQKKILQLVRDQITAHGLEPVSKPQWANTGAIHVEQPGKFGALAKVSYSFQDGNFTLSVYRCDSGRDVGVPSQPPRQGYFDHYLQYSDQAGFETFKRIFQQTLDAVAPKPKVKKASTRKKSAKAAEEPKGLTTTVGATAMRTTGPVTLECWAEYKGRLRLIVITFDDNNVAKFCVDGVECDVPVAD